MDLELSVRDPFPSSSAAGDSDCQKSPLAGAYLENGSQRLPVPVRLLMREKKFHCHSSRASICVLAVHSPATQPECGGAG